jgi:hypothetical protein
MTTTTGSRLQVAARLLIALFCWFTAAYAFVASSAFAYLQFLKPRVLEWVARAAELHHFAAWSWLALLAAVLIAELRASTPRRRSSITLLAGCAAAVAWNSVDPVLPALAPGGLSIVAGCLALVPLLWLSALDHAAGRPVFRSTATGESTTGRSSAVAASGRLLTAAAGATVFCTALYAMLASIGAARAFEPDLTTGVIGEGVLRSVVDHGVMFGTVFVVTALVITIAGSMRASPLAGYAALMIVLTIAFTAAFVQLVAGPIGLEQPHASFAGAFTAASIVATWSGLRLRALAATGRDSTAGATRAIGTALDIFAPPAALASRSRTLLTGGTVLAATAFAAASISNLADWNFLVLNCATLGVWTATFVLMARVAPARAVAGWLLLAGGGAPLLLHVAAGAVPASAHGLDRFSVYNPSYRFTRTILDPAPPEPLFNRFLRANARLTDVRVEPVSIDFATPLQPRSQPPDIYLFVVDSLRPDYLAAYNRAVAFTPNIARFAAESLTFRNAFTRFGATGLSVPAIWAGAALPHKQYVLPFAPMNALMKLLRANGYRRMMAMDSVVAQLLPRDADLIELERDVPVMEYDLCRTLDELERQIRAATADRPLFAYALPQNLHMSHVRSRPVPAGERYDGFVAPLAAEVHRLDTCFGSFIDELKRQRRYENSIVVLTSDHGDSLGEGGRWGHSYTLVPEVVSVPLIVHLPAALAATTSADLDAVSFSTDITPTLYAALGYDPRASGGLTGRPLIGEPAVSAQRRRRDPYVLTSSYGAVYAALRQNGTRLYIADAINNTESAYVRRPGAAWNARPVDPGERLISRLAIRRHLDELARVYNLDLPF